MKTPFGCPGEILAPCRKAEDISQRTKLLPFADGGGAVMVSVLSKLEVVLKGTLGHSS